MRSLFGTCSFLLFSAALVAQTPKSASALLVAPPASQGCPVDLSANRLSGLEIVRVKPGEIQPRLTMHVIFRPAIESVSPSASAIVSAKVTLHGMAGSAVVSAGSGLSSDATEDLTVLPAAEAGRVYRGTVRVRKLTAVTFVEVDELTYADGTKWRASENSVCRVTPNGYLLVAGTR